MSKGPLALVLTGFPITLWTVWNREWKNVWNSLPWIKGALLMLALSLPWYLLAERQTPGFLHYFIVGEHFQRFTVKGWQGDLYGSGHASPLGTIWLYGLTMFLPWTLLLPLLRMKKLLRYLKNYLSGRKFLPVALGAQPPALLHSGPQYPSGLCAPRHPGLVHPDRTGALAMEQPPPGNQTSYLPPSLHIWHHGHFPAGARIRPT